MQAGWLNLKPDATIPARIAAIAEPGFVLIAGTVVAHIALSRFNARTPDHYLYDLPLPDFFSAAVAQLLNLAASFAIILGLAFALGLWRGRSAAASYGLTLGNERVLNLIGIGILLGLVASLPEQILRLVSEYARLGPGTRFWKLETRVPWNASFWIYMAVGSYFVVPILEELFTRGYLLGRFREALSPGGALLAMAAFFVFAHGQYRHPDALALGAQITLLVWSVICGYAVYRKGSLIPVIIAHAIINVPITRQLRWAMLAATLLGLATFWSSIAAWASGIIETFRGVNDWVVTSLAIVAIFLIFASIGLWPWMLYVWIGVLGVISVSGLRYRSAWPKFGQSAATDEAA